MKGKLFDKWTTALLSIVLVAVVVLGGYHFLVKPTLPEDKPVTDGGGSSLGVAVASDSCIACHTNEAVIAAAVIESDDKEEASGG